MYYTKRCTFLLCSAMSAPSAAEQMVAAIHWQWPGVRAIVDICINIIVGVEMSRNPNVVRELDLEETRLPRDPLAHHI